MKLLVLFFFILLSSNALSDSFTLAEDARIKGNDSLAVKYYKQSADEGNVEALHWLGIHYLGGIGVESDPSKAINYFKVAASMNVEGSMVYLANFYLEGIGLNKDCVLAEHWIKKFSNGKPTERWQKGLNDCKKNL